jgi:hypothetical protein
MEDILRPWRQWALWSEVGNLTHFPAASTVLQRRAEYRCVLQQHIALRMGSRIPLDPERMQGWLASKDVASLYELWAAVKVMAQVCEVLGEPHRSSDVKISGRDVDFAWGLMATWPNGVKLEYNRTFSPAETGTRRTWSVELRPDLALYVPSGLSQGWHLFDAKFRLKYTKSIPLPKQTTKALKPDIHKMHAYRDAIVGARSAWVLYPGDNDCTWLRDGEIGTANLAGRAVEGVGAFSLKPGKVSKDLGAVLNALLGAAESKPIAGAAGTATAPPPPTPRQTSSPELPG